MPDSAAIKNGLIAKLLGDSALQALMPDGVYYDVTAPGKQRFVIVALMDSHDEPLFGERGWEDCLFLVKAVAKSTSGGNTQAAAKRIDDLLENGTLSMAGYALMTLHRERRVEYTEVDAIDASIRWQHCGGHYRLMASG